MLGPAQRLTSGFTKEGASAATPTENTELHGELLLLDPTATRTTEVTAASAIDPLPPAPEPHRASVAQLVAATNSGHHRPWVGAVLGALLLASPVTTGADLAELAVPGNVPPMTIVSTWETVQRDLQRIPLIPPNVSAKFKRILLKTVPRIYRGTVAAELAVVSSSVAANTVAIEPRMIFRTMASLIEQAQYDVAFQTFAWNADSQPAQEIFNALYRLNQRRQFVPPGTPPVVVRFLIDTMDSGLNGNGPTSDVMRGIEARVRDLRLDPARIRIEVAAHRHSLVGSLHSKSLVVDGHAAVVTGANANHNDNFDDGEHDAGFLFVGNVARGLLSDFDHAWLSSEVWTCGTQYPRIPTVKGHPGEQRVDCLKDPERIQHVVAPELPLPGTGFTETPMLVLGKPPVNNLFVRDTLANPLADALLEAMAIGKLIRIMTPNLNDEAVIEALTKAVLEGRRVQVLMGRGYEDFAESVPGQGGTNEEVVAELYEDLKRRGVKDACDLLQIRWYSHDGITPVQGNAPHATHVKAIWIDDELVFVMSKNMDTQSWRHSRELGVLVDSPYVAHAWMRTLFLPDFRRSFVADECKGVAQDPALFGALGELGSGE